MYCVFGIVQFIVFSTAIIIGDCIKGSKRIRNMAKCIMFRFYSRCPRAYTNVQKHKKRGKISWSTSDYENIDTKTLNMKRIFENENFWIYGIYYTILYGMYCIVTACTIQYSTCIYSYRCNLSVTVTPHSAPRRVQHSSTCKSNCSRKSIE